MATTNLNPRDYKGLLFIRDGIVYGGRIPSLQAIADYLGFKSRRSSVLLIERLIKFGYLDRTAAGTIRLRKEPELTGQERTIPVPLVGSVACGLPLLADENVEALIPVSQRLARPGAAYFLLRAVGTSMNLAGIHDGDLVLVRQQPVADAGSKVVALINDEATVKIFRRRGAKVILEPHSTDAAHQPIILDHDFLVQGVVIDVIPGAR